MNKKNITVLFGGQSTEHGVSCKSAKTVIDGINAENAIHCTEAGANVLVAGSALFKTKRPRSVMAAMREAAREHPFIG